MRFSLFIAPAALAALLLASTPANATILGTYSDRSLWTGATTGVTTDNLNDITLGGGGYNLFSGGTLTRGALTYTGFWTSANQLVAVDGGYGSSIVLKGPDYHTFGSQYVEIAMAGGATAAGLDFASMVPAGLSFRIELSTGEVFVPLTTPAAPALTFWGVRADTQFNWLRVSFATGGGNPAPTIGQSNIAVDNVAYGSSALPGGGGGPVGGGETPEAGTLLLIGSGLTFFASRRRKLGLAL